MLTDTDYVPILCLILYIVSGDVEIIGVRISAFDERAFKAGISGAKSPQRSTAGLPSNTAANVTNSSDLVRGGSLSGGRPGSGFEVGATIGTTRSGAQATAADGASGSEKVSSRHVQWEAASAPGAETVATASRGLSKSPSPATDRKDKMPKVKPELSMKDNKDCE